MTYLYWFYYMILGASLGSFLTAMAIRLPKGETPSGRSHCDNCLHTLAPLDLIPLLSYLSLGGRCRYCHVRIPPVYFLAELGTGLILALFAWHQNFALSLQSVLTLVMVLAIVFVSLTDIFYQVILDEVLVLILGLALLINGSNIIQYLGGAIMASAIFGLIHLFSSGRAMGFADAKYVFVMGLALPITSLFLAIYLAFLTGGAVSAILILTKRKKMKSIIAFGPFLSIGFLIGLWLVS